MRFLIICISFFLLQSAAMATPIVQHFTPQPRMDIPRNIAGADKGELKQYEIEIAYRLNLRPEDPSLGHQLGTILFHQGRIDEARSVWQRTSKKDPNLAPADFMADFENFFSLLAKNNIAEAQEELKRIESRYRKSPYFYLIQGERAMQSSNFDAAQKAYLHAVELAPDLYITNLNMARFFEFQRDHTSAQTYFTKALEIAPENIECWTRYGVYQFKQGQFDNALKAFRHVKTIDSTEPAAEIQLAKLSLKNRDNIGARHWYKTALHSKPENANAIRVALSDVQLRLGLIDEASEQIQIVLKNGEQVPLLIAMGTIEESKANFKEAKKYYRRALSKEPDNVIANNNLAMILVRADKLHEEAFKMAAKAFAKLRENPMVMGSYAGALYRSGKDDQARDLFAKVVVISPADAWSRYFYGLLLLKERKIKEALVHLEGVLIIDPDFPEKASIQSKLDKYSGGQ